MGPAEGLAFFLIFLHCLQLQVPGRPTNLDKSRARAYCACSGCGWGLFGHFYSRLSLLSSFSLSVGDGPI